jgi:hypothetical protein
VDAKEAARRAREVAKCERELRAKLLEETEKRQRQLTAISAM